MSQDPPLAASGPAMAGGPVTIRVEQVALLSVTGQLDEPGLDRLQCRIDGLLDDGVRLLLADLSGVAGCDGRLFGLLSRTQHFLERVGGWLRLVGLAPPVLDRARPGSSARGAAGLPSRAMGRHGVG